MNLDEIKALGGRLAELHDMAGDLHREDGEHLGDEKEEEERRVEQHHERGQEPAEDQVMLDFLEGLADEPRLIARLVGLLPAALTLAAPLPVPWPDIWLWLF